MILVNKDYQKFPGEQKYRAIERPHGRGITD